MLGWTWAYSKWNWVHIIMSHIQVNRFALMYVLIYMKVWANTKLFLFDLKKKISGIRVWLLYPNWVFKTNLMVTDAFVPCELRENCDSKIDFVAKKQSFQNHPSEYAKKFLSDNPSNLPAHKCTSVFGRSFTATNENVWKVYLFLSYFHGTSYEKNKQ